jgi:aprataxin
MIIDPPANPSNNNKHNLKPHNVTRQIAVSNSGYRNYPSYSMAFPSISTTAYKFDIDIAAKIACDVIKNFLAKNPDKRIRLYLVDINENSETLHKFKEESLKVIPPEESRFAIICANLTQLKTCGIPCHYIVNASNPYFQEGGSGTNQAIHDACKSEKSSLRKITFKRYPNISEAETGIAYPVDLPPQNPLRMHQDVRTVIHIVGPNMNPNRPRCMVGYDEAGKLLQKTYEELLMKFNDLAMIPKSSNFI